MRIVRALGHSSFHLCVIVVVNHNLRESLSFDALSESQNHVAQQNLLDGSLPGYPQVEVGINGLASTDAPKDGRL